MIPVQIAELPPLLREIAELIGIEAALALSRHAVGRQVHIPERPAPDHWLSQLVGPDRAKILAHRYGHSNLTIPKASRSMKKIDAARLYNGGKGLPIPRIAYKLQVTSRYVRKLLREVGIDAPRALEYEPAPEHCPVCGHARRPKGRSGTPDPAQLDLFPTA